jgi:hypothetical protein
MSDFEFSAIRANYKKQNNLLPYPVVIGDGNNPCNIVDPDIPGNILCRYVVSQNLFVPVSVSAPMNKMGLSPGQGVKLKTDEFGDLYIAGYDNKATLAAGGSPYSDVVDTAKVGQQNLVTLLPEPKTGTTIHIKGWQVVVDGVFYNFVGADLDLSSVIPAAGDQAWILVALDNDYATPVAYSSTAVGISDLIDYDESVQECLDQMNANATAIWMLLLSDDQSSITQDDFDNGEDLRQVVNNTASSGTGDVHGPASSTDNAVPRFVGTSGTQIENTGVLIGDTGALTVPGTITLNIGSGSVIMSHAGAATTTTLTLPQRTTGLIITTPGASTDNVIQPSGDDKALVLKNNASQTANILEHHPSGSSTPLWSVSAEGHFGLGVATAASEVFRLTKTFTDPATTSRAVNINPTMSLSTNGANGIRGFNVIATVAPGGNTASSAFAAIAGQGVVTTSGSGTVSGAIVGLYAQVQNGGTVALANGTGLNIDSATNAGTYTNNRGIVVAAQTAGSNNTYILLGTGTSPSGNWTIHATTTNSSALAGALTVGAVSAPVGTLNTVSTTGAIVTIARNDTSVDSGDTIGLIQFWGNDTQLSTQNIFANIEVQAAQTITTDAAAGKLIVRVTGTGAGGSPVEQFNLIDGTLTLKDALNVAVNTSTGTKIGTATTQKLGLWNATPVVQPASANQAAVATTAATQTTPWGYSTQAQADGIITLLNELRSALMSIGAIKGSA